MVHLLHLSIWGLENLHRTSGINGCNSHALHSFSPRVQPDEADVQRVMQAKLDMTLIYNIIIHT